MCFCIYLRIKTIIHTYTRYFAVAFSLLIEFTNIRVRKKRKAKSNPVKLNKGYDDKELEEAVKELNK